MIKVRVYALFISVVLSLAGCSTDWSSLQAANATVKRDSKISTRYFRSYFKRAHVAYPPTDLALLIFKKSRVMEVYAKKNRHWRRIVTFPILAASGHAGPKLKAGDQQVPEGIYHVVTLNPMSNFDLSMKINYPNEFDRHWARVSGRHHLGGEIFIHGGHRSIGCVAIGNWAIQRLYPLVRRVGESETTVVIAPGDFRRRQRFVVRHAPRWLPILYANIRLVLAQFPLKKR